MFIPILVALALEAFNLEGLKSCPLVATEYSLDIDIDFESSALEATCLLTLKNRSSTAVSTACLLLYPDLHIDKVRDARGLLRTFEQDVVPYDDWSVYRIRRALLPLDNPLEPNETITFAIEYSGSLNGYQETGMTYLRDRIDRSFTILRTDCEAFPRPGYWSLEASRRHRPNPFEYGARITVPEGWVVANGGVLKETHQIDSHKTFHYESALASTRMDFAIAPYHILRDANNKVFYFEQDREGAERVMASMTQTMELYQSWFGELREDPGFAVIEIPEGWGSQADVSCILQTAAAFKNASELRQLYHEISHLWNVPSRDPVPPRWEEGLATFLEYHTADRLHDTEELQPQAKRTWKAMRAHFQQNASLRNLPMTEYGEAYQTDLSYRVGMIAFYLLHGLIGEANFRDLIAAFYDQYIDQGATTAEFVELCHEFSDHDLTPFLDDWFLTPGYVKRLLGDQSLSDVLKSYRD